jgi:lipopolysaccharide/colanic/teichoic acid biosynthesis glycosyltransferase
MFQENFAFRLSLRGTQTRKKPKGSNGDAEASGSGNLGLISEELFTKLLSLERKRSERSRKQFVLMLVDAGKLLRTDRREVALEQMTAALSLSTRDTDIRGWYREDSVVGVILTEFGSADMSSALNAVFCKVNSALRADLGTGQMNGIHISFHVFPDDLGTRSGGSADFSLYPDFLQEDETKKAARLIKRAIDIAGSLAALILLSPLLLAVAIAIKLTSKGPTLFKQTRVGQYGVRFTFLKFRSMYFRNDPQIHQDYVTRLISGEDDGEQRDAKGGVYKIKDDPRITPVGTFLRKTSLDELPQFFNVLKGEMSLVGPRPPIPYEVEAYDIWHRRRLLEVKPGITGLWQVNGRSKVNFEDMVRLDLKYARTWSLGLDFKILLGTPRAVFFGDGAY